MQTFSPGENCHINNFNELLSKFFGSNQNRLFLLSFALSRLMTYCIKHIYRAERRAHVVMSSRKMKCSEMAATKRSSLLRGSVLCLNLVLLARHCQFWFPASSSYHWHMLRFWKYRALACLLPSNDKAVRFPKLKCLDERDLSGVVLSCFHCNDFILEALGDSQPNFCSDPASCKV